MSLRKSEKERQEELVGIKEIVKILDNALPDKWYRQKVHTYYKRGVFPQPDMHASGRPFWKRKRIEEFKDSYRPSKKGRRRIKREE